MRAREERHSPDMLAYMDVLSHLRLPAECSHSHEVTGRVQAILRIKVINVRVGVHNTCLDSLSTGG